jgi:hypothetical protein
VDIERLNAVVFFRYLESSISFYQMVGRGTRIDEPTQKYKFSLYDYTGVTELFGTDFITAPKKPSAKKTGGDDEGGDLGGDDEGDNPPPLPEIIAGELVLITLQGRFIPQRRAGRDVLIPVEQYRPEMIRRVLAEAQTLEDFRRLWVETQKRRHLIEHLIGEQYSPNCCGNWLVYETAIISICSRITVIASGRLKDGNARSFTWKFTRRGLRASMRRPQLCSAASAASSAPEEPKRWNQNCYGKRRRYPAWEESRR